jgi:hypothetical protein
MATCIVPPLFMAEIVFSLIGDEIGMAADTGHAARPSATATAAKPAVVFEYDMRVKASVALTPSQLYYAGRPPDIPGFNINVSTPEGRSGGICSTCGQSRRVFARGHMTRPDQSCCLCAPGHALRNGMALPGRYSEPYH